MASETKSKGTLIGVIVGGLLLICCCLGVGGIGVATYGLRKLSGELGGALGAKVGTEMPKIMEAALLGAWQTPDGKTTFDFLPDGKLKKNGLDLVYKFSFPDTLEIGPDVAGKNQVDGKLHPVIRYRVTGRGEMLLLFEISDPAPGAQPDGLTLQRR